ncbi:signal peptidase II [Tabrizicola sp.]|uniref:signal peptidase II n=1 Tax=Tabrizicola sp. TaxID=2005166 RepID=UPI00286C57BD|nr:signal peptidase II [Tabrizicola sp.]
MRQLSIAAVLTFLIDQVSKLVIVQGLDLINRGEIDVAPPYLVFRMAWNRGVNFGLFANNTDVMRWVLIAVALAISAWVVIWIRREKTNAKAQVAAGLLIGGALGNVIDRIVYGAVADFLNMSCCGIENPYAFNVADVAIFVGALGLVIFAGDPAKVRKPRGKSR